MQSAQISIRLFTKGGDPADSTELISAPPVDQIPPAYSHSIVLGGLLEMS